MNLSDAKHLQPTTVEDYLAGEAKAKHKHEYVDGLVFMMAGGTYAHNLIASNALVELGSQLKGTPCRALNSDSKVRVDSKSKHWFYYPDVIVVCGDNIRDDVYQDRPTVIVEVMSKSSRRIDGGEKLEAYQKLETLTSYILLEQNFAGAIVYRRSSIGFEREIFVGPDTRLPLPEVQASLSLAAVYAEVKFVREAETEYEPEAGFHA